AGTMERSDSLPPSRRASLCFTRRYHEVRLSFAPVGPARVTDRPGVRPPVSGRMLPPGEHRASQVPGEPRCAYAVFCDPGGTAHTRPLRCVGTAPSFSTLKAAAGGALGAQ